MIISGTWFHVPGRKGSMFNLDKQNLLKYPYFLIIFALRAAVVGRRK